MRIFSEKYCREYKDTFRVHNFPENRVVCDKTWKNMVGATQAVANKITRRMRYTYRATQSTDEQLEYVILIAFP